MIAAAVKLGFKQEVYVSFQPALLMKDSFSILALFTVGSETKYILILYLNFVLFCTLRIVLSIL